MRSDEIELEQPPIFNIGDKVRLRKMIKNDGTFPGQDIGVILAKKGEIGYVASIGTYLQRSYIYAVHFLDRGFVIGCLKKELELVENEQKIIEEAS